MIKNKEHYQEILKTKKDYKRIGINFLESFFFGGLLCLFGQVLITIFKQFVSPMDANLYMIMVVIFLAGIFTAFGVYDNIGQIAKSGLAIPISGFANSCVSSAMEYKKEGLVIGIGANCLKIAGTVLVLGSVAAIVVSSIKYFFEVIM